MGYITLRVLRKELKRAEDRIYYRRKKGIRTGSQLFEYNLERDYIISLKKRIRQLEKIPFGELINESA